MASLNIGGGILYDGSTTYEIDTRNGTEASIQALGAGSFKVLGKMDPEMNYTELTGVAIGNDFPTANVISDEQVYMYDVSVLSSITVSEATGFTKIKAKIINR